MKLENMKERQTNLENIVPKAAESKYGIDNIWREKDWWKILVHTFKIPNNLHKINTQK